MQLYIFDSCPFCIRVRVLTAIKQISCEETVLLAGDYPTDLVAKVPAITVPMLAYTDAQGQEVLMQESIDILAFLDQQDGQPLLSNYEGSAKVKDWLAALKPASSGLTYPRMDALDLAELASPKAQAFSDMIRPKAVAMSMPEALAKTSEFVVAVEALFNAASEVLDVPALLNGTRQIDIDDLLAFADLRNLAIVAELSWPQALQDYVQFISEHTAIPMYAKVNQDLAVIDND